MRALYWFREDLRLLDNPALTAMAEQAGRSRLFVCPACNESLEQGRGAHGRAQAPLHAREPCCIGSFTAGTRTSAPGGGGGSRRAGPQSSRSIGLCGCVFAAVSHLRGSCSSGPLCGFMFRIILTKELPSFIRKIFRFSVELLPDVFSRFRKKNRKTWT